MARTDANPPMMPYTDEYQLVEVDADYLTKAVKPKQFIHIDQTECIMCEGCVDICPWKCIHMVTPTRSSKPPAPSSPATTRRTRWSSSSTTTSARVRAVRRPLPDGCHHPRQGRTGECRRRPTRAHPEPRVRIRHEVLRTPGNERARSTTMAKIIDEQPRPTLKDHANQMMNSVQGSQVWSGIFRPGSIFRKGYTDSPRNRSYVIMNSVLYHLHPVKVKRHTVKVSYTLCLGGLSFFLFILLTVTGIFLMFFYRPEATAAWDDISNLQTSVTFGLLVRNMHRWGAHLMVLTVFLHMARVFYHGAYKPPREFNWVIGVILLTLTLLLSFTGYLLPWDQLALWAVTVGTNMMGYTPVFGQDVRFVLLGGREIGAETLLAVVRAARIDVAVRHRHLHGDSLLAGPQGRRNQWSALMVGTSLRVIDGLFAAALGRSLRGGSSLAATRLHRFGIARRRSR